MVMTLLILYTLALFAGFLGGSLIIGTKAGSYWLGRTATGGAAGAGSAWLLTSLGSTTAYLDAATSGVLGIGGLFMLISLFTLLGVWGYNLFRSRGLEVVV
jgi:hypothetical protein